MQISYKIFKLELIGTGSGDKLKRITAIFENILNKLFEKPNLLVLFSPGKDTSKIIQKIKQMNTKVIQHASASTNMKKRATRIYYPRQNIFRFH